MINYLVKTNGDWPQGDQPYENEPPEEEPPGGLPR
jgi:hypothetical protein